MDVNCRMFVSAGLLAWYVAVSIWMAQAPTDPQFWLIASVLPMSDQPVRTLVSTDEGELAFQHYFVRRRCEPVVKGFRFDGADRAQPSPEVIDALSSPDLRGVIVCPSNPYVSIGPMLAVAGFRGRLQALDVPIVAVSPIVGGKAIKGPAAKMMQELATPPSA